MNMSEFGYFCGPLIVIARVGVLHKYYTFVTCQPGDFPRDDPEADSRVFGEADLSPYLPQFLSLAWSGSIRLSR
jgi:hypothetical protein